MSEEQAQPVLVVISKMKDYIRKKAGMNTSDKVAPVITDRVRELCDKAIERAQKDGRKTILERDFYNDEAAQ